MSHAIALRRGISLVALLGCLSAAAIEADDEPVPGSPRPALDALEWEFLGPDRGGRVNAVAGHPSERNTYFAGYTGGGVWKTTDGGVSWANVSDGFFNVGSIGAIAVAESDPDIVYVGTGEHALRGDVSHGDGVYKSVDGGKTWTHVGLPGTQQIGRIVVHPDDENIVYVAAIGSFTADSEERGVFRSDDGGRSWQNVLFVAPDTGVNNLVMDRNHPDRLYASSWQVRRYPWGIRNGGVRSNLYRSDDGGKTWQALMPNADLPGGAREKMAVALSDSRPGRVWALISGESGAGLFRSDDYGASWVRTNSRKKLLARTHYFNHLRADPVDADSVYVLNDRLWRSTDGGVSFDTVPQGHADHHDLWIDPADNARMIDGTDGGAEISLNRGKTWTTLFNQPTGQFYSIAVDDRTPYRIYGSQQDWSTIALPSRQHRSRDGMVNYTDLDVSEAGRVAFDQRDADILYISDHHWLVRYDLDDRSRQYVGPRDETNYGWGTADIRYRFNWTFPVQASIHDPRTLYTASQFLHRSTDRGNTWKVISPDLTRADPRTLERTPLPERPDADNGPYWGPVTRDSNGDNWAATIFSLAQSPLEKGVIWTGSDDGYVHVTTNSGKSWQNVTPEGLPEFALVTSIEADPREEARAYLTASAYRYGDLSTQVYRTDDRGKTWRRIVDGLPGDTIVRRILADPERPGLLYLGTEQGVYASYDGGGIWRPLSLNLPSVPVYDMTVKDNHLLIATHGRGFWRLRPLEVLRRGGVSTEGAVIVPEQVVRWTGNWSPGTERHDGLGIYYTLPMDAKQVHASIHDAKGELVRSIAPKPDSDAYLAGLRMLRWDLRYPNARRVDGVVTRGNQEVGPFAPPGRYTVRLTVDGTEAESSFRIVRDPRSGASDDDVEAQFRFAMSLRDRIESLNSAVVCLRTLRPQAEALGNARVLTELAAIENQLVQVNAKARKDLHANPVRLNDKFYRMANFLERSLAAPTKTQYAMFDEFSQQLDDSLEALSSVAADFDALPAECP